MSVTPRETVRIASASRSEALDLARRLVDFHTHLVQLGDGRWHVCVTPGADERDLVPELLLLAGMWAADRRVDSILLVGDRSYELNG